MLLDETWIMASKNVVKIVGSTCRKKHKTTSDDSLDSITIFQTGNTAGKTRPSVYLVNWKGKNVGQQAIATKDDNDEEDKDNNNDEVEEEDRNINNEKED